MVSTCTGRGWGGDGALSAPVAAVEAVEAMAVVNLVPPSYPYNPVTGRHTYRLPRKRIVFLMAIYGVCLMTNNGACLLNVWRLKLVAGAADPAAAATAGRSLEHEFPSQAPQQAPQQGWAQPAQRLPPQVAQ